MKSFPCIWSVSRYQNASKRIGIIFRGIRIKNDLTQAEVAERLGIDQSDVSKIEKEKRPIGKALAKIEKEFGIDYRRLLKGKIGRPEDSDPRLLGSKPSTLSSWATAAS